MTKGIKNHMVIFQDLKVFNLVVVFLYKYFIVSFLDFKKIVILIHSYFKRVLYLIDQILYNTEFDFF